ncbi:MAG: hypothetical protein Q3974_00520 [Rothia sp. (in: high G+C Gram-positive bacteria)]|nr:hypothetical protein [Rothia sp. (in: high G+C Gram-positive bacteria)]
MSWMAILLPLLLGVVCVFVPGLLVACAMKLRGLDAVGLAPALSIAMIAISAMVAPMVGITWALWVPFAFALLMALLGFCINFLAERMGADGVRHPVSGASSVRGHRGMEQHQGAASVAAPPTARPGSLVPSRWFSREQGLYYISWGIGALLLARNIKNSIGNPEWISQTYDNNFHLNVIRYIADTGSASSLTVGGLTSGDGPIGFYPAAWHALVSLVFESTNVSIPVATNTVALLVGAVVWPLSVIAMMRSIFKLNAPAILTIGALSAAFTAFPVLLLFFGVLYPNFLGVALIPAGVAVLAQMFRVVDTRRLTLIQTLYLGIFIAVGIALAHPNAIMSLLVFVIPLFVTWALLQIKAGVLSRTPWWVSLASVVVSATILWLIYFLWGVVRPPKIAGIAWGPTITSAQAYGEAALNATMGSVPQWMIFALFIVGLLGLALRKNRQLWFIAAWCVIAFFYAAARSLPWDQDRYWVVGVWYHDSFRLAALLPLATLPFTVFGIHWLVEKIVCPTLSQTLARGADTVKLQSVMVKILSVVALGIVIGFGQSSKSLHQEIENTFWEYAPDAESNLLSSDEIDVLNAIDNYVPKDEKILVQPFTGGALAYAIADREVNAPHTIWKATDDDKYLRGQLNQIMVNPKVCEVLERDNFGYYLDFGDHEVNGSNHSDWFQGYQNMSKTGGVTQVYRHGDAVLYKITACDH